MSTIQVYNYSIRSYQSDMHGHLFIHQLFNFLQDTANQHANNLGFGQKHLTKDNLLWVLSRLSVEVFELPSLGQEIEVQTWVKSVRGSISEREFRVKRGDTIILNASSLWFCLSNTNHKPAKVPEVYLGLMTANDVYATSNGSNKVLDARIEDVDIKSIEKQASYSDIDSAQHVNNAAYIRWAMDAFPSNHFAHHQLSSLSVNYLNETFIGNKVLVKYWRIADLEFLHSIENMLDGSIICRIKSNWLSIPPSLI